MRPAFRLTASGGDITGAVADRLLGITVHDEAETKSDRLTVTLDDRPEAGAYADLPDIGTTLSVALGYAETGVVDMGTYTVDEIDYSGPPATIEIKAKAANMPGAFRSPASKSWDDTTLGAIFNELAGEHGYATRVDSALASVKIPHADMTNESPMAFLNRLAGQYDGVAKPIAGYLVLAPKGKAKAATGQALPEAHIALSDVSRWRYAYNARNEPGGKEGDSTGGVKTVYWDKDEATMKEVATGSPPYQNVKFASAGEGAAKGTGAAVKNKRDREKAQLSLTLPGNPSLAAEQKLVVSGFRPRIPTDWRITTVEHKFSKGGYTCDIKAELFQQGQTDAAGAAADAEEF